MTTDNELIAEFMGVVEQQGFYDSYNQDEPYWFTQNDFFRTDSRAIPDVSFEDFIENCKYSTSWDWLIQVIDKIRIKYVNDYTIKTEVVKELLDSKVTTSIEILHKRVIKFIKWYNERAKGKEPTKDLNSACEDWDKEYNSSLLKGDQKT